MNEQEIARIEVEAQADEMNEAGAMPGAGPAPGIVSLDEEFADFLDMAAGVAGAGFALPSIPQRFNHGANLAIAQAAIKLCEKYGLDARAVLIGQDSTIGAWLGLIVAVGLPGYGCFMDYKAARAREVKAANDENGGGNGDGQQSGE